MSVLYISYDGLCDNLGRSQIIPYIVGLSRKMGLQFDVLTFEKAVCLRDKALISSIKDELSAVDARWAPLAYHKSPALIATAYDLLRGVIRGLSIIKKNRAGLIHGRSFIGSVIALFLKKIVKTKVIFDVRGFWPEERVEAGIWKKGGWLYKLSKAVERSLVLNADEIVMLTLKGQDEFKIRYAAFKLNITVIPTCVDTVREIFQDAGDPLLGSLRENNRFVIVYIGSISTWYMPDEMFNFFDAVKKVLPGAFFLILTKEEAFLKGILAKRAGNNDDAAVRSVEHKFVPSYLSAAKIGLAFYRPGYSRKACCPTKVGEYLAQGLPVVINAGVGDCDEIIHREKIGLVINSFSPQEYETTARELKKILVEGDALRLRCKASAKKYYSLDMGVERYQDIYSGLMESIGVNCK